MKFWCIRGKVSQGGTSSGHKEISLFPSISLIWETYLDNVGQDVFNVINLFSRITMIRRYDYDQGMNGAAVSRKVYSRISHCQRGMKVISTPSSIISPEKSPVMIKAFFRLNSDAASNAPRISLVCVSFFGNSSPQ